MRSALRFDVESIYRPIASVPAICRSNKKSVKCSIALCNLGLKTLIIVFGNYPGGREETL